MTVKLPYQQGWINLEIEESRISAVLEPNEVEQKLPPEQAVRAAVESAGKPGSFQDFLESDGRLLVIVNDGTRPTPTRTVLEELADQLESADPEFIVATGVHRAPTEQELEFIFGSTLSRFRDRISAHDARLDETWSLGTTSRGTAVKLNVKVRDADRVLIIGSVEPHYFAGYTGGRKGFLPGVAAYGTIEQNHKLALSPEAATLALCGNPVHEDMLEACRMIDRNVFTIMTVLDREQEIYAVTAGGLEDAFERAVEKAAEVFVAPLGEAADVVVACARYPMDIDLYQSQKAVENAKLAVKPGGTLILVSSCRDGIGEKAFSDLLGSCETADAVFRKIEAGYKLGYHKAAKIADICGRVRVAAYTGLEPEVLESVFIEPVDDLQGLIDGLLRDGSARLVIMPDASVTVPAVK